jgi:hypothetical protein
METYIKAGNAIKYELENAGYDVEIGINRFTDTISVKINEYGSQQVPDVVPHIFNHLNDEDDGDEYIYTIEEEEAQEYMDDNYDEDDFNDEE